MDYQEMLDQWIKSDEVKFGFQGFSLMEASALRHFAAWLDLRAFELRTDAEDSELDGLSTEEVLEEVKKLEGSRPNWPD